MVRKVSIPRILNLTLLVFCLLPALGLTSLAVSAADTADLEQSKPPGAATANATATAAALMALQTEIAATETAIAEQLATPTPRPKATKTLSLRTPTVRVDTPTPTPTPGAVVPIAEVLVGGLNIRSGPGSSFSIVGSAEAGQRFPVSGQSGTCAWLQVVLEDGTKAWISGAAAYTSLNVACDTVTAAGDTATSPAFPTPTPAPAVAAATLPTATPTVASAPTATVAAISSAAASSAGNLVTSFEPLGTWRRGDQPYGTLTQPTAQAQAGSASAALAYDFPADAGTDSYVVFLAQPELPIPAGAQSLTLQVYGDGSGHFLNAWIRDTSRQVWQTTFGRITHSGWAPMTAPLVASREWPNGPIGDATSEQLTPPLTLRALVLDGAPDGVASSGTIYLDALTGGSEPAATAPDTAPATAASATEPAATATTPAPVPSASLTGKIAFTRSNGRTLDTLIYDVAANGIAGQFANLRQPDLTGGYLLVSGDGGPDETIMRADSNGANWRPVSQNTEDTFPQFSPALDSMVYASQKAGDRKSRIYWQADASEQQESTPLIYSGREIFGDYPVYLDNWRIAYQGCNTWAGSSQCGIYTTDTHESEPVRATDNTSDIPSGNLGSRVLFSSNRGGNWDVWVVNWDGSGLQQLTTDPAIDGLGTSSPDGKSIAFITNRGGTWAVWVMNADGTNQRKLFDIGGTYGSGDYDWIRERISWGT